MNRQAYPCGGDISACSDDRERTVIIPVDNMEEYQALIKEVRQKYEELNELIKRIEHFDIKMKITF